MSLSSTWPSEHTLTIKVSKHSLLLHAQARVSHHLAALYGGRYLKYLLDHSHVSPKPSSKLDELYTAGLLHPTRKESRAAGLPSKSQIETVAADVSARTNNNTEEIMLLRQWNGKLLAERLGLPELQIEVERAVDQVEESIRARAQAQVEKASANSTNTPSTTSAVTGEKTQ